MKKLSLLSSKISKGKKLGIKRYFLYAFEAFTLNRICEKAICFYQRTLSPLIGRQCRFYPTCSEYARLCFVHYSFIEALGKSIWRILRCQPLTVGYEDYPFPVVVSSPIDDATDSS